jgi:hypothetical protein
VATAVYVLNRCPTQSVKGSTLYEVWHGVKLIHHFRTFGCVAHIKQGNKRLTKLEDRGTTMVFVGYEHGSKAWHFYNPSTECMHISYDAVFKEDRAWDWNVDKPGHDTEPFIIDYFSVGGTWLCGQADMWQAVSTSGELDSVPLGGHRAPTPVAPGMVEHAMPSADSSDLDTDHDDSPRQFCTLENILGLSSPPSFTDWEITEELLAAIDVEPSSADEALKIDEWCLSMLEEMASIEENKTWTLVKLPHGHRAIGLKWVFILKYNEAGVIIKHKARLVAKGYVQQQGIDFDEVFAPVT